MSLRHKARPSDDEALAAICRQLAGQTCQTHASDILADAARQGWALAYALAWLSVAGGNSVMPPWVRHQFPQAGVLIKRLRGTACADPACQWCRERHDARKELTHWFGFAEFRPKPADEEGRPLQQAIVEAAMPVSYTHLDVYKRQLLRRVEADGRLTAAEPISQEFAELRLLGETIRPLLERHFLTLAPVSYTHLDVYKRQAFACPRY